VDWKIGVGRAANARDNGGRQEQAQQQNQSNKYKDAWHD
jgi:hypothetical protein